MKELLKKEKVRALINKAKEDKITYEEINEELKDDFPIEKIEKLIHTIIETGGKIVSKSQLEEEDEEEELDEFDEHEEEHKDSDDYIEHEDDILDEEEDDEDKVDEDTEHFFDDEFNPDYVEDISEDELTDEKLLNLGGRTYKNVFEGNRTSSIVIT